MKHTGIVKWFNDAKGYGFIVSEDFKRGDIHLDIFVHYRNIKTDGFKTLSEGQEVTFKADDKGKGFQAYDIEKVQSWIKHD